MAETARERLVRVYAYQIYIDGYKRFSDINATYHEEIKQYAAANFTLQQIDSALARGWLTQQEYDDTVGYIPAS